MTSSIKKSWVILLLSFCSGGFSTSLAQIGCAGVVDPAFTPPQFDTPLILCPADDGVVAAISHGVVRLDRTGAMDANFGPAVKKNGDRGTINGIERDGFGRYVIWGDFDKVNFTPRPGIARILADGSLDSSFVPPAATWNVPIATLQPNHGIVLGIKTNLAGVDGITLARLNENGSLDSAFNPGFGPNDRVVLLAAQADDKILVSGGFKDSSGQFREGIRRLLPNGALDAAFSAQRRVPVIHGLKALPDGKFLTYFKGGLFIVDGPDDPATNSIVRYNNDGSVDTTFTPQKAPISDVEAQIDGKYLITGFGTARLLANGQFDPTFNGNISFPAWTGDQAYGSISIDSNQEIYATGNSQFTPSIFHLLNDQDPCVPRVSFERDQYIANESENVLLIPLIRTGNVAGRTTVTLTWWPSYSTNLVFNPGEDRVMLQFPLGDNHLLEPSRQLDIDISNLSKDAVGGSQTFTRVIITDATSANGPGSVKQDTFFKFTGSGYVSQIAVRSDGKVFVGGWFTNVNGVSATNLVRFNSDFSIDSTFQGSFETPPSRIAVSSNLLYASYTSSNSLHVVRLNANGSADPTFVEPMLQGPDQVVLDAMAVQPDGKLIITGPFTNVNGVARAQIARLNTNGSLDADFDAGYSATEFTGFRTLVVLADGSILAGSPFRFIDGQALNPLTHFSNTGARLSDFQLPSALFPTFDVYQIIPEPAGGALIVGGQRSLAAAQPPKYAIRFTAAGEIDPNFNAEPLALTAASFAIRQPDGKYILYGYDPNKRALKLARFFNNGALDQSFYSPAPQSQYSVAALASLPNGDILIGGSFEVYNDLPTRGLALLRGGAYSGPGVFELEKSVIAAENSGAMKVKIHRLWSTSGSATVRFKTRDFDNSPFAGVNYMPVDTLIMFADGQSEAEVSIPLIDTTQVEQYLLFEATLEAISAGAAVNENGGLANLRITDDQPALVLNSYSIAAEGSTYRFSVQLFPPFTGPVTVDLLTEAVTAIPGVDFIPLSTNLTFTEANSYQEFEITLPDDNVPDPGKLFRVKLQNPHGGALGDPSSLDVTINDNAHLYRITPLAVVASQEEGSVTLQVVRADGGGASDFRLTYKTEGGTAIPGVEYVPQEGEMNLNHSEFITIPLLPNHIVGPPTTFQVRLSVAEGEIVLTDSLSTITLRHPAAVFPAGSRDPSFKPVLPNGSPASIYNLASTSDFLYLVGYLPDHPGPSYGLHRYRLDGSYDLSYSPAVSGPMRIFPQPDGKLFTLSYYDGLLRLNPNGSLDTSFQSKLPGLADIVSLETTPDGKILLAGGLSLGTQFLPYITQLLPTGEIDPAFARVEFNDASSYLNVMARLPNGNILIGGPFKGINGVPRPGLARLLPNGALDPSFNPSPDIVVATYRIYPQPDGKIVLDGAFWKTPDDAELVLRFNEDGSLDTSWNLPFTKNDSVQLLGLDQKGRAYFSVAHVIKPAEQSKEILRTLSDGSIDPSFYFTLATGSLQVTAQGLFSIGDNQSAPILSKLYLDPPAAIDLPQVLSQNRVGLYFNFPANLPYILERTGDFKTWTTVSTGSTATGDARIEVDVSGTGPQFFRLRQQ